MAGFPCRGLLRELRQHDGHQGQLPCDAILRCHSIMPSLVHMLDVDVLVRLPVAVFFPCVPQVDADAMVWLHSPHDPPRASLRLRSRSDARRHMCPATSSAFRLLSRVGEGDIPALRCGLTGSCSSTFQYFSLGNHLGVTTSPQSPLPAGYVTLPVDGRSPPLGLMSPHSRGQANLHILLSLCIPVICLPDWGEAHHTLYPLPRPGWVG